VDRLQWITLGAAGDAGLYLSELLSRAVLELPAFEIVGEERTCPVCGDPVTGQNRIYCSQAHNDTAYRRRKRAAKMTA
jgi:predicted nucleic acid-binding Zn ribbon protein